MLAKAILEALAGRVAEVRAASVGAEMYQRPQEMRSSLSWKMEGLVTPMEMVVAPSTFSYCQSTYWPVLPVAVSAVLS